MHNGKRLYLNGLKGELYFLPTPLITTLNFTDNVKLGVSLIMC